MTGCKEPDWFAYGDPAAQGHAKPRPCWPWSHNWSKWEDIERGKVVKVNQTMPVGSYLLQQRTCYDCNKKQLRREVSAIGYEE